MKIGCTLSFTKKAVAFMTALFVAAGTLVSAAETNYSNWIESWGDEAMLANGSIDQSISGDNNWNNATDSAYAILRRKASGGYKGGYMEFEVKDEGPDRNSLQFYQQRPTVAIEKGSVYKLSFYSRVVDADSAKINRIWFRNIGEYAVYSDTPSLEIIGNEWKKYEVCITANTDSPGFRLMIQMGGNGQKNYKMYFDEFSLVEIVAPDSKEAAVAKTQPILESPDQPVIEAAVFSDTLNHWAKPEIESMYAQGVIKGKDSSYFEPESKITRAEFLALIIRAAGLKSGGYKNRFSDVKSNDWYANVVQAAIDTKIIDENMTENNYFKPDANILREEMTSIVTLLYENQTGKGPADTGISSFKDSNTISPWAVGYVKTANQLGIINGVSATEFAPKAEATRAEATVIVHRLIDDFIGKTILQNGNFSKTGSWSYNFRTAAELNAGTRNGNGTVDIKNTDGNKEKGCLEFDVKDSGFSHVNAMQLQQIVTSGNGQNIIEKDKTYKLTFYAKLENLGKFKINIIKLRDRENKIDSYTNTESITLYGNEWRPYTVLLTSKESVSEICLVIQMGGDDNSDFKVYFDDISLKELKICPEVFVSTQEGQEDIAVVTGGGSYYYQENATLLAAVKPEKNYIFEKWIDNRGNTVSENAIYSFAVNSDKSFKAVFKENLNINQIVVHADSSDTIGLSSNGEYKIDIKYGTGNGNYKFNEIVTANADSVSQGKVFSHWERNNVIASYSPTYKFYASGNTNLVAKYADIAPLRFPTVVIDYPIPSGNSLSFVGQVDIPDGYKTEQYGLLLYQASFVGELNLCTDGAVKVICNTKNELGQFAVTKANVSRGSKWVGRAYIVCKDSDQNIIVCYSNTVVGWGE